MRDPVRFRVEPAPDTTFYVLGDKKGVFSQPKQKLYSLNDIAAFIWCGLADNQSLSSVSDGLVDRGVSPSLAKDYVQQAVREWLTRDLLRASYDPSVVENLRHGMTIRVANFEATIRTPSEPIFRTIEDAFGYLRISETSAADQLWIFEIDDLVHVVRNGTNVFCCSRDELLPMLKARISDEIVATCAPDIAFHAACLVRNEKCLLIGGISGAGKTTLTLRLLDSGFAYGADDITLISLDGRAKGLPLTPAAKSGAWKLISKFRPDLASLDVHIRRDGKRARFVVPRSVASFQSRPVAWMIFLKRASAGAAVLTKMDTNAVLARMIDASFLPNGQLDLDAFGAIKQIVANAAGYELSYADLDHANDIIDQLCNA